MRLVLTILLASTALSGCGYMAYFVRDRRSTLDALEVRMDPAARRECLVVLMPGLGDTADAFLEHGFVDDAARASSRCDFVAVDAHLGYYTAGTLQQRVGQDILRLADARGYRECAVRVAERLRRSPERHARALPRSRHRRPAGADREHSRPDAPAFPLLSNARRTRVEHLAIPLAQDAASTTVGGSEALKSRFPEALSGML